MLEINGLISGEQLNLNWAFSTHLHKRETIEALAQRYLEKLRALTAHCRTPEESGYTPSDFTGQGLSQARLDKIMGKLRSSKNT